MDFCVKFRWTNVLLNGLPSLIQMIELKKRTVAVMKMTILTVLKVMAVIAREKWKLVK